MRWYTGPTLAHVPPAKSDSRLSAAAKPCKQQQAIVHTCQVSKAMAIAIAGDNHKLSLANAAAVDVFQLFAKKLLFMISTILLHCSKYL